VASDRTMLSEVEREALLAVARCATPADLSILDAALMHLASDRPTLVTTMPGSNNDKLWSQMAALGWMRPAGRLDPRVISKLYVIDPAAGDAIRAFLADNARAEAMTEIINEFRGKIPSMLIDAVHGVDGTPAHLAILLAGVVEGTMRRAIKPELHDEFLREVAKVAEAMRSN
jgi:hypothetical protein